MAAPSKSWVAIADSQVDADSPLDTVLMTAIRDDLVHLEEWLGKDYTAAVNHTHNGVDAAPVLAAMGSLYEQEVSINGGYSDVASASVYIPANANTIEFVTELNSASATQVKMRLRIDAAYSDELQSTNGSYEWITSEGSIDVSALSGWTVVYIQLYSQGGSTGYGRTVRFRLA